MQTDRFNLFVIRVGRKLNRNIPHLKLMPSIVDNQIHIKRQKTIFSQFGQISITAWALQIQKSLSFHLKNIHPFLCSTNYPHKMLWLEILCFPSFMQIHFIIEREQLSSDSQITVFFPYEVKFSSSFASSLSSV